MRRILTSRTLAAILVVFICVNVTLFAVQRWGIFPLRVPSASMKPALKPGDRILVARSHASPQELARRVDRGDVLVFRAPQPGSPLVVKRVVGLPGETIQALDGVIAINNDRVLNERYLDDSEREAGTSAAQTVDIAQTQLGPNEVYVLGDNRDASIDSRTFGPVPLDNVVGTVQHRIWPPGRWGKVRWQ